MQPLGLTPSFGKGPFGLPRSGRAFGQRLEIVRNNMEEEEPELREKAMSPTLELATSMTSGFHIDPT